MKLLFYKIIGILGTIIAIFHLGKRNGKEEIKNKIIQKTLSDVEESKKRQKKRISSSNDSIGRGLSRYIREE